MAPSIWLTNLTLLCVLKRQIAAAMPGYWALIPANVADAILASPTSVVG